MDNLRNLKDHFAYLNFPKDAIEWLLEAYNSIQVLDDVKDKDYDKITDESFDSMVWFLLVGCPINPFYVQHKHILVPVIANALMKWNAANAVEKKGLPSEVSFVWRAAYYDLVLCVATICHGRVNAGIMAPSIMGIYSESFEKYKQEFSETSNA